MKQLTIQSLRFLIGFQEDIKIMIKMIIVIIIIVIIIVILACPDARCESGQTSGSCRSIRGLGLSVLHISFGWLDPIVSPFSLVESLLSRIRFA